ncbi:MAG: hypothetical protein QM650_10630 [Microlunatus sp.]
MATDLQMRDPEPEAFAHLLVPQGSVCWWCQQRPATTGEHKFKRTDLARLMMPGNTLIYGADGTSVVKEIRGKSGITRDRHKVIKFPKSMCEPCNNGRSKPFDEAYEIFSSYVDSYWLRIAPGVSFVDIYGPAWKDATLNLARYYGKHFGCRMARSGLPIPQSLRDFLNGDNDMHDAHMALITTDSVRKQYGKGLYISPDYIVSDGGRTRFKEYVLAAYIGAIGVRYQWSETEIPDRSQFFHFPGPVLNCFRNEADVATGSTRRQGWFARFSQWLNKPADD